MAREAPRAPQRDVLDRLGVGTPGSYEDPTAAAALVSQQLLVLSRVLLTPVLAVGGLVAPDVHPVFWAVLALRVVWQATGVVATLGPAWRRYPSRVTPVVDLALTGGLLLSTGGGDSPLRIVLVGLPVVVGYLVTPATVAAIGSACLVTFAAAATPDLVAGEAGTGERLGLLAVTLAASTVAGVAFAYGRRELTLRADRVEAARRALLHAGLSSEDRERRRISHDLHGEALQVLLAAAQDFDEGGPEGLRRAREGVRSGVAVLRHTMRDLHPLALRHAGLEAAVHAALAHRVRGVSGVTVAPGVDGQREALLLSLVRDLGDALADAGADAAVTVDVRLEARMVVLELDADARLDAVAQLRAGLAGVLERVEADGGTLTVGVGRDGRAALTVRVPRSAGNAAAGRHDDEDDLRRRAQLLFSGLWVAMAAFAGVLAGVGGQPGPLFAVLLSLIAGYHLGVAGITLTAAWDRVWGATGTVLTLAAFGAAVAAQGGIDTPLAWLAFPLALLLVLVFGWRGVGGGTLVLSLALAVAAAPDVADDDPGARVAAAMFAATFLWAAASAVMIAVGRQRMRRRLAGLALARRRLLYDSLTRADGERHRISMRLHDGALQELMIAGQDLDLAIEGDRESAVFARVALTAGLDQLRDTVAELHPPALEHGGLRPALKAVLDRFCARGDLAATIEVDPGAEGVRDELVVALVRELVTNVGKHARATTVSVRVTRTGAWLGIAVDDDGVGIAPVRLTAALAEGHIGLASARERAEAEGGSFRVESAPDAGTRVRITVRADAT